MLDLSEMIGLTRTSLTNIELGRQRITIESLHKICGIFNCQYADILPPIIPVQIKEEKIEQKVLKVRTRIKKSI